jgi:hypothetical protein
MTLLSPWSPTSKLRENFTYFQTPGLQNLTMAALGSEYTLIHWMCIYWCFIYAWRSLSMKLRERWCRECTEMFELGPCEDCRTVCATNLHYHGLQVALEKRWHSCSLGTLSRLLTPHSPNAWTPSFSKHSSSVWYKLKILLQSLLWLCL